MTGPARPKTRQRHRVRALPLPYVWPCPDDGGAYSQTRTQMEDFWTLSFFTSLFLALRMSGATSWPWRVTLRTPTPTPLPHPLPYLRTRASIANKRSSVSLHAPQDVFVPLWILYTVFLLGVLALIGRVAYSFYDRNEVRAGRLVWATLTVLAILLVVPSFAFLVRRHRLFPAPPCLCSPAPGSYALFPRSFRARSALVPHMAADPPHNEPGRR